jgi:D-alanyl-D-alanine carboxypeptidase (penicillin-binding protein 5/6)
MKKRILSIFLAVVTAVCLAAPAAFADTGTYEDIDVAAKAALLVDADTGQVLYEKNIHGELYPASITKCMTVLLTLKAIDEGKLALTDKITATETALSYVTDDSSSVGIKSGEELTVEQLLYCAMVASANEACDILAENVGGSIDDFVKMMNDEASSLGCENTHFANPSGLQDTNHYTSAWDIYLIVKEAMKYEEFMKLANTKDYIIPATNLSDQRHFYTTNYLLSQFRALGYLYSNARGIKTGHTSEAGYCLVSSAQKGSRSLISVVLGCEAVTAGGKTTVQSFSETKRLFEWGFNDFHTVSVLKASDPIDQIPVTLSSKANYVVAHPASDVSVLVPNNVTSEDIKTEVKFNSDSVAAPVTEGQVLGTLTVKNGDAVCATVDLLATNDVPASRALTILHKIKTVLSNPFIKLLAAAVVVLIVVLIVLVAVRGGRSRYRGGRSYRTRHRGYRGRRRF